MKVTLQVGDIDVDVNQLEDATLKAAFEQLVPQIKVVCRELRCPVHDTLPETVCVSRTADGFGISVTGCCDELEQKLFTKLFALSPC